MYAVDFNNTFPGNFPLLDNTLKEKLQSQFNTKMCKNRILAAPGYCLQNQLIFIKFIEV